MTFSYLVHPKYVGDNWPGDSNQKNVYFFRVIEKQKMPVPDYELLASLERTGVPTVNNMILGDRVVSKLNYTDSLRYATFLAQRATALFNDIRPTVIIGAFDALHSGIVLATARRMNIPWFALNFSVIPTGLACFCDQMNPASKVALNTTDSLAKEALASKTLKEFEDKRIRAPAYIAPLPPEGWRKLRRLPSRLLATFRTLRKSRHYEFLQFVEYRSGHSVLAALNVLWQGTAARRGLSKTQLVSDPPASPYVFFGLHMQPESSIDVWAPFYSNQEWVVELISRSLPPTHKLMVKIHKSDVSNYSRSQLERMKALPGVELVGPGADARTFVDNADLVIAIQGTIGLEAALVGKPVLFLGASPVTVFPNASRIGEIHELPNLIKSKLAATPPSRHAILNAFSSYLEAFRPAIHNNWTQVPSETEIDDVSNLFDELKAHLSEARFEESTCQFAD